MSKAQKSPVILLVAMAVSVPMFFLHQPVVVFHQSYKASAVQSGMEVVDHGVGVLYGVLMAAFGAVFVYSYFAIRYGWAERGGGGDE